MNTHACRPRRRICCARRVRQSRYKAARIRAYLRKRHFLRARAWRTNIKTSWLGNTSCTINSFCANSKTLPTLRRSILRPQIGCRTYLCKVALVARRRPDANVSGNKAATLPKTSCALSYKVSNNASKQVLALKLRCHTLKTCPVQNQKRRKSKRRPPRPCGNPCGKTT